MSKLSHLTEEQKHERWLKRVRKYYRDNKERIRKYSRAYYKKNRVKLLRQAKQKRKAA
jgi:hypothetical protein